jgi:hypothetical protein
MKLAIITVNYNNYPDTQQLTECINQEKNQLYKIFVADLSDKKISVSYPQTEVIDLPNKGYAFGVNAGLKKALEQGFTQFVVVNNDIRTAPSFIERVLFSLEKHPQAIVGGKIYYEKNYEYHRHRYQGNQLGKIIWYAGGEVDWNHALTHHLGVDEVDTGQFDQVEPTQFVTGCLMAFDKRVVDQVGFWDEGYFLYYEDADYCQRAKAKKIKLVYDPSIVIWHKNAQSTGGAGSKLHQRYQKMNRLKFGLKYAPLKTKLHLIKNFFFQ